MPTVWSISASDIIRGALELNEAIDATEAVSAQDSELCLRAFNGIMKELPLHGLSWPELTNADVAVTWSNVTPDIVIRPADYFGVPTFKYTAPDGKKQPLVQLSRPAYLALDLQQTATYPSHFFEQPDRNFKLWPIPTIDPVLTLGYQSISDDVSLTIQPDIQQAYLNLFELWVADRISMKFGTASQKRMEINGRMKEARELMIQWAVDKAPLIFAVDGR